mmetsp:Transcript_29455/g.87111  ORF Transcript_29455/g.87111 Transcript_29455/m.87111 type:complete len:306 (+) Transcript_29455:711-1628(+)
MGRWFKSLHMQGPRAFTQPPKACLLWTSELRLGSLRAPAAIAEPRHGERQDMRALLDLVRGGEFVRPVAPAIAARDEDHAGGRNASHEQRVMVRAADHALVPQPQLLGHRLHGVLDLGAAGRWGILVHDGNGVAHVAARRDVGRRRAHLGDHSVAPRAVGVADINAQHRVARHAVDSTRRDEHFAGGADSVGVARAKRRSLYSQRQLSGGEPGVVPERHQLRACVPTVPVKLHAERRRRRNRAHNANVKALRLQLRALFNVKLHKVVHRARGHARTRKQLGVGGTAVPDSAGGRQESRAVLVKLG